MYERSKRILEMALAMNTSTGGDSESDLSGV